MVGTVGKTNGGGVGNTIDGSNRLIVGLTFRLKLNSTGSLGVVFEIFEIFDMLETVSSCVRFACLGCLEPFFVKFLPVSMSSAANVDITRFASSSELPSAKTTGL